MPIALQYETTRDRLVQAENDLQGSQDRVATLDDELEKITIQLAFQSQACQDADEAVNRWEAERGIRAFGKSYQSAAAASSDW